MLKKECLKIPIEIHWSGRDPLHNDLLVERGKNCCSGAILIPNFSKRRILQDTLANLDPTNITLFGIRIRIEKCQGSDPRLKIWVRILTVCPKRCCSFLYNEFIMQIGLDLSDMQYLTSEPESTLPDSTKNKLDPPHFKIHKQNQNFCLGQKFLREGRGLAFFVFENNGPKHFAATHNGKYNQDEKNDGENLVP